MEPHIAQVCSPPVAVEKTRHCLPHWSKQLHRLRGGRGVMVVRPCMERCVDLTSFLFVLPKLISQKEPMFALCAEKFS